MNSEICKIALPTQSVYSTGISRIKAFVLLTFAFAMAALASGAEAPSAGTLPVNSIDQNFAANRPSLGFERNVGQDDSRAQFLSYTRGYQLRLDATRASLDVLTRAGDRRRSLQPERSTIDLKFLGSNNQDNGDKEGQQAYLVGEEPISLRRSYLRNGESFVNVQTYKRVTYNNLYKDIGLSFYENSDHLEYDFILKPWADAQQIRLGIDGTEHISLDADGNLLMFVHGVAVKLLKPVAYQPSVDGSGRISVPAEYRLQKQHGTGADVTTLSFSLGAYDHKRPLVIDPVLVYGLDIPGAPGYSYPPYYYADTEISAMTVDGQGNTYVAASISSTRTGASILKFDPNGKLLLNVSIGTAASRPNVSSIAVDAAGNICIAGSANSGLPTTPNAFMTQYQTGNNGYATGFISVISADGSSLLYSTYLGGANQTQVSGLAVDSKAKLYVVGTTNSTNFPTTPGTIRPSLGINSNYTSNTGFLAKIDPTLSGVASLVYSTYLEDPSPQSAGTTISAVALDAAGDAYVAAFSSAGYPVTSNAYVFQGITGSGAYVSKVNPTATALIYSAYLGPGNPTALAIDGSSEAYVVGAVRSAEFPTTAGTYQSSYGGGFALKLNSTGTSLLYSTFLSGPSDYSGDGTQPTSVAVVPGCVSVCEAHIAGYTLNGDFPLINPIQSFQGVSANVSPYSNGPYEAGFLVGLAPNGKSALYSTYLGAATSTTLTYLGTPAIAADRAGNVYFASNVQGFDAPVTGPTVDSPGYGYLLKISQTNAGALLPIPAQIVVGPQQAVNSTNSQAGSFQLRNMGSKAVTLNRPFAFSIKDFTETDNCGTSLAAGALCLVNVGFTPTVSGVRNGTLTISSSSGAKPVSVSISGTAKDGPALNVSASVLNFASQIVRSSSAAQVITLTNTGNQPQTIYSIANATSDFKFASSCGTQIAAGASCQLNVQFTPTQIGVRTDTLVINTPPYTYGPYNYSSSGYAVSLSGVGIVSTTGSGSLLLSPTSLNFGSLVVGTYAGLQTITLTNSGNVPVTISSLTAAADPGKGGVADFYLSSPSNPYYSNNYCGYSYQTSLYYSVPFQLAAQSSCAIVVGFSPTVAGQETGSVQFVDTAVGSPQSLGLSGIGLDSVQALTINPSSMTFGAQPLGTPSAVQTFQITNPGQHPIAVDRAYITGDFAVVAPSSCEGFLLTAPNTCTISVVFQPKVVGARTGTLTLTDSYSSQPQVFNLSGTGTQASTILSVSQSTLNFPAQTQGTTSSSLLVVVSNPSTASIPISGISTTGEFAVSSFSPYNNSPCNTSIAANTTCSVAVVYSPTIPTGKETGTLTVHTPAGNVMVALAGTATSSAQAIQITPTSLNFGKILAGDPSGYSNSIPVYIQNTGGQPVTFPNPPTITGVGSANSADFVVDLSSCANNIASVNGRATTPLAPGASCAIYVGFTPSVKTTEQATLSLVDSAGTQTMAISGTGVATQPAVLVQPVTLAMQSATVGVTGYPYGSFGYVTLTNKGAQTITIKSKAITAGSSDFTAGQYDCVNQQLVQNSSCDVQITFQPSAAGYRTGTLTFTDTSGTSYVAALAGYGLAPVDGATLNPHALILAGALVGTTSSNYNGPAVVLTNTGTTSLTIGTVTGTNTSASGDFPSIYYGNYTNCNGVTVSAGNSCALAVGFSPHSVGKLTGSLTVPVRFNDGKTASFTATLSGQGLSSTSSATFLPQSVAFPDAVVGQAVYYNSYATTITLQNTGTASIKIGAVQGVNLTDTQGKGGDFAYGYDYCGNQTLAIGQSCKVQVQFVPIAAGARSGSISYLVSYTNGTTTTFTSQLTGNGIAAAPQVMLSQTSLAFNVEVLGTIDYQNVQTVTLTNIGNANATISSILASPNYKLISNQCGTAVTLQNPCDITVAFAPQANAKAGPIAGTLTIVDNTPTSPHVVKLSGVAISTAQQLALSQTSISFGNQTAGVGTAPEVVYLTYLGSSGGLNQAPASTLQINSIALGGTNAADFTETQTCGGSLGFTMSGRTSCMIAVAFTPAKTSLGTRTAKVTVTPATGPAVVIQLVGIGVAAAPAASVSPASVAFAARSLHTESAVQTVSVTNTTKAALAITEITTTLPSEFTVVSSDCAKDTLKPGASCRVTVAFHPTGKGALNARLMIRDVAGSFIPQARLRGTGVDTADRVTGNPVPVRER